MDILYLANIRLPTEKAHGIQIMKTCEAFAQAGANVELVVPTRRTPITEDPFAYYGVARAFTLTRLREPDLVRFGSIGFLSSLLMFSEHARWLRRFWSADIIYSRDAFVLLQYLLLGRRLVFEAHAEPTLVSRFAARHAYRVVVISRALAAAYEAVGVPRAKIVVAPDAADVRLFDDVPPRAQARAALGLAPEAKIVVYTGHFYARKGADTLAQAAARVPEAQFIFVGGTVADVAKFRMQWGSQANITIAGHVPQARALRYMRAADALVLPNSGRDNDSARFTSPMKLFEYMASGTPIIASDVPAIREVLEEQDATFFAPDDPAALAASIASVFVHERDAREKAKNAQQKAEGYTWDKRAKAILDPIKADLHTHDKRY